MKAWGEVPPSPTARALGRAGDGSKGQGLQDRESMAALHGPRPRDEAWWTEHRQGLREPLDAPTDLGTEVRMCVGRVERQQENGGKWPLWESLEDATRRDTFQKAKGRRRSPGTHWGGREVSRGFRGRANRRQVLSTMRAHH